MTFVKSISAIAVATTLCACGPKSDVAPPEAEPAEVKAPTAAEILQTVIDSDLRTDEEKARDSFRNPHETLTFFGITPNMTVVEVWPGGGWYTNIIAPYLATDGGTYIAAQFSPDRSEQAASAYNSFVEKYTGSPETFGDVKVGVLGGETPVTDAGSADAVLTFRNVHNWMYGEVEEAYFAAFFEMLKPGGTLGVVEHRADTTEFDPKSGYVAEDTVIALAQAAGFELVEKSDINANAADTKDHPFGVWTLPPVRRSSAVRGQEAPDLDRTKYDAIGESDRMTLKFRKPETTN